MKGRWYILGEIGHTDKGQRSVLWLRSQKEGNNEKEIGIGERANLCMA